MLLAAISKAAHHQGCCRAAEEGRLNANAGIGKAKAGIAVSKQKLYKPFSIELEITGKVG